MNSQKQRLTDWLIEGIFFLNFISYIKMRRLINKENVFLEIQLSNNKAKRKEDM